MTPVLNEMRLLVFAQTAFQLKLLLACRQVSRGYMRASESAPLLCHDQTSAAPLLKDSVYFFKDLLLFHLTTTSLMLTKHTISVVRAKDMLLLGGVWSVKEEKNIKMLFC